MDQPFPSVLRSELPVEPVGYNPSSRSSSSFLCLGALPSERIGIRGEYDHYGLARRVEQHILAQLGAEAAAQLQVKQRGGVVILSGRVGSRFLLDRLVTLTLATAGATQVDTNHLYLADAG
ncbi:MAG: BON domain-containing protein [Cyanobacteria bacterium REEB459]|nr:BON domain-containing protein [Cyanobacteria bacterium REEB459]